MRINAVIQARTGSTRLPGKVLEDLGGRPVLEWVVRAAQTATQIDTVIVATSTGADDDTVADLAASLGVPVVRGSEDDVLSRFVDALDAHPADAVVRLTADCPLLDPALIDAVAGAWAAAQTRFDYVSTVLVRCLPRGMDVELVTAAALRAVDRVASGHDRVHVTSLLYAEPTAYRLLGLCVTPCCAGWSPSCPTGHRHGPRSSRCCVPARTWWPSTRGSARSPLRRADAGPDRL
jgi:spore coat polysaccharide biosynthesis protein SpsF